jgi:hypothetical protein
MSAADSMDVVERQRTNRRKSVLIPSFCKGGLGWILNNDLLYAIRKETEKQRQILFLLFLDEKKQKSHT